MGLWRESRLDPGSKMLVWHERHPEKRVRIVITKKKIAWKEVYGLMKGERRAIRTEEELR